MRKFQTLVERCQQENPVAWNREITILDTTEKICELMESQKISNKELAKKMGIREVDIEHMLDGDFTFGAFLDIFAHLGYKVKIEVEKF